ncbi:MAG: type I restriction-modification system subunit M [Alphaproteobacteria bacterium]|nr:type I restriction-modification system subunit M [Alphaproteobacteria bacterium]
MAKITQDELNKLLWNAADSARGTVDASVFKDYILAFLFFKYISDLKQAEVQKLKERYGDDQERIDLRLKNARFILPKGSSFYDIYAEQNADNIGELINIALHKIEDVNSTQLHDIFTVDFNSQAILGQTAQRNKMIRDMITDFNKVNLAEVEGDLLGNAYMYLIERFGSDAGKKAGEFYTPKVLSSLLAKLAMPKPGDRICDPACGSGGLLLLAGEEVQKQGSNDYALYGQEKTGATYNLARMNMFLHGQDSARIEWGDTLNNPMLVENDHLMQFDIIVANPPFSLDKWGEKHLENDIYRRFDRGMPPASKGDYAFISHMVATAKPKSGRVAVIVPHGVLFRGSSEGKIRQAFIEENILDAVIGLPANLFLNVGIPVAFLIFDKSREKGGANENRKDVLFIDASKEYVSGKKQNTLSEEHINKIVDTYKNRREIEKYSHIATFDEIKENDFNLNIPRYVDTFEEEEEVDLAKVKVEIVDLENELQKVQSQMTEYLKELGV